MRGDDWIKSSENAVANRERSHAWQEAFGRKQRRNDEDAMPKFTAADVNRTAAATQSKHRDRNRRASRKDTTRPCRQSVRRELWCFWKTKLGGRKLADKSKHHDVLLDPKHVTNDQKINVVGTFKMVRMPKSGISGNVEKAKKNMGRLHEIC